MDNNKDKKIDVVEPSIESLGLLAYLNRPENIANISPMENFLSIESTDDELRLRKIEQFIRAVAVHTGAGVFYEQDTKNMALDERIRNIDLAGRMAVSPLIDKIDKMRGFGDTKTNVVPKLH